MRTLILNRDLKTLFGGVSIAAVAGLLMGGVMYPNLDADKVGGPQIQMNGGGPRSDASMSQAGVSAYGDRVPDYVVGTDSLKPPQYQVMAYNDRAEPEYTDTGEAGDVMAYEAPPQVRPVRWEVEPAQASSYPSQHGNIASESDLPAPPAPPAEGQDYGDDSPTGD
jgi:hypothetical protein